MQSVQPAIVEAKEVCATVLVASIGLDVAAVASGKLFDLCLTCYPQAERPLLCKECLSLPSSLNDGGNNA
jgi:hypothetical protein